MPDVCTDNRFEVIAEFKKKLIEATNIETSPEEMAVLDNILFRFWQMGWLESIDRMTLVKESAKTLIHSAGNSVSAKVLRNAGRLIQNAIDGKAPEFEFVQASSEIPNNSDTISRQVAINTVYSMLCKWDTEDPDDLKNMLLLAFQELPSAQPELIRCKECKWYREGVHLSPNKFCYRLKDNSSKRVGYNFADNDFCSRAERKDSE